MAPLIRWSKGAPRERVAKPVVGWMPIELVVGQLEVGDRLGPVRTGSDMAAKRYVVAQKS